MARPKRRFTTFNLSFLDIMSCGFGAVVLVFLIIDHSLELEAKTLNADLLSEINLLEEDIREGTEGLVRLKNTLDTVNLDVVTAEGEAERIQNEMTELERLIAELNENSDGQDAS
jgi:peptidoglycan hydrolase CwlO-like protein